MLTNDPLDKLFIAEDRQKRHYQPWEDDVVRDASLSAKQAAEKLGRSVTSVLVRRKKTAKYGPRKFGTAAMPILPQRWRATHARQ